MTKHAITIGLINPKSPENVGAVMRAAKCYQADQVLYTGQRYDRAAKLVTDTKKARDNIPLLAVEQFDLTELLVSLDNGILTSESKLVCVDLIEGAVPLPQFQHPQNAIYLFGPEDGTIPQSIVNKADHVVFVPTIGCMNLAASVNVLLYDRLAKSDKAHAGNELILQSRDTNNRVKVKTPLHE